MSENHALRRFRAALAGRPDPGREPPKSDFGIHDTFRDLGKMAGLSDEEIERIIEEKKKDA
jgi:hypothetical protein